MQLAWLLLLVGSAAAFHFPFPQPTVITKLGAILGFDYMTKSNVPAEVFLGIPFAMPPVGPLRFEKPLDPVPFGILNATSFGNICVPHTRRAVPPGTVASEDCLTMNIMRPKHRTNKKLPVLVWIHGGGFEIGSAKLFNYAGFADNYIPKDIIVVSFQYRLGVHGFLSLGLPGLNGNYGMFDMAKALEFVDKYIGNFGGDKNKVTVWGLSAGGCAAGQMALSPYTRDKVAGAIEMSGTPYSYWGIGTTVVENSLELVRELGCVGLLMKTCLKTKTLDQIYDAVEAVGYTTNWTLDTIKWGPTIDGDFFPNSPFVLAREAPPKPLMAGVSNKDAGYFALLDYSKFIQNLYISVPEQAAFTREKLISIIKTLIEPEFFKQNTTQVWDMMVERYAPPGKTTGFYLDAYNMWANNIYFFSPTVDGILSRREAGWPIYAYSFDHFNPNIYTGRKMVFEEAWGSVHTNEYTYMFDMYPMTPFNLTQEDQAVKEQLVSAIASFTKTGVPTVPNLTWPQVGDNLDYYIFKAQPEVQTNYYKEEYDFMNYLRDLGFDLGFLMPTSEVLAGGKTQIPY